LFVFGHEGITLGAAWVLSRSMRSIKGFFVKNEHVLSADISLGFDLRFIALGAMLPDIVDKPLSFFNLGLHLEGGRTIGHTLVFFLLLLLFNIFFANRLLAFVAFGTGAHLILDSMWQIPRVLFWPAFGFSFPSAEKHNFFQQFYRWFSDLTRPDVFVPEIIGAVLLFLILFRMLKSKEKNSCLL